MTPMLRRFLVLAFLPLSAAGAAPCNVTDRELLGSWEALGKGAAFEQMAFALDGAQREFNSWRHERPEVSQAHWRLQDCTLTIREASSVTQTFTVLIHGKRLLLSGMDGKAAGAYRVLEERLVGPGARAAELRTPTYLVRITENCPEGEVGCRDVGYLGKNLKTGKSIALRGQAVMRPCADRVTPCGHEGYRFTSGQVEYRVMQDGLLLVTQGGKVFLEERGQWQSAAAQPPAAPGTLAQRVGVRLQSGYTTARAKLLGTSWKADSDWGESGVHKQLAYRRYPEVLCGDGFDAVCTGRFEKGGQAILLTIDQRSSTLRVTSVDED